MDGADCLGVEEFWKRLAGEETERFFSDFWCWQGCLQCVSVTHW